jgi:hypothetical protein
VSRRIAPVEVGAEVDVAPSIVASTEPDCAFYRTADDAIRAGLPSSAVVFDSLGRRLELVDGQLRVAEANGVDDLARILRDWLGHMDALRESTANWSLPLLLRASIEHLGYSA